MRKEEYMRRPANCSIVIFGASGDLTKRKLIPSLYDLFLEKLMPEKFSIIGASRTEFSDEEFRKKMEDALNEFGELEDKDKTHLNDFLQNIYYQPVDSDKDDDFKFLKEKIDEVGKENESSKNILFYLSTPPSLYEVIPKNLAKQGLNSQSEGWRRLIIEKPFGYDLESAIELEKSLKENYEEDQIYRIDHYLGKETVQNIMVSRFSNGIFEPLWNRNFIHHVEITSTENIGVENRGGYYDKSGALRDMVQNHLMQIVGVIAMEPPSSFDPTAIRNETMKVFQSIRKLDKDDIKKNVIRGQYISAKIKGEAVKGYREEEGVDDNSKTETYAAIKFYIDNWRWGGVPFYVRTGKRLPTKVTEVVIHFKPTPHWLFGQKREISESCNSLVVRIQPDEGILLKIGMKVPGQGFKVQNINLDFHYSDLDGESIASAYERLLHDCMLGDSTLYARGDAVIELWKFIDPILKAWQEDKSIPLHGYPAGTWGPDVADDLIEEKCMTWRYPCRNLTNDSHFCEL